MGSTKGLKAEKKDKEQNPNRNFPPERMGIVTVLTLQWTMWKINTTEQEKQARAGKEESVFPSLLVGKLTTPHGSRGSVWGDLSAEKQTGIKLQLEPADR